MSTINVGFKVRLYRRTAASLRSVWATLRDVATAVFKAAGRADRAARNARRDEVNAFEEYARDTRAAGDYLIQKSETLFEQVRHTRIAEDL